MESEAPNIRINKFQNIFIYSMKRYVMESSSKYTDLHHLLLTEKGGGFAPVDQFYVYDRLGNQLTFVDLKNKTIRTKTLSDSAVEDLNSVVVNLPDFPILKPCTSTECTNFGLSYYRLVSEEKRVPESGIAFWDDKTKGTESLNKVREKITELSG